MRTDPTTADPVLQRLRIYLLLLAGGLSAGALVELWAAGHTEEPLQWVPFVLCGLSLVAIAAALLRPQRGVLLTLRGVMLLMIAGSLLGIYEHVAGNIAFAQEIRPGTPTGDLLLEGLTGGNPLLAPGTLAVAALIALAATYCHPALAAVRQASADAAASRQTQARSTK
jgi:hypothetical protein